DPPATGQGRSRVRDAGARTRVTGAAGGGSRHLGPRTRRLLELDGGAGALEGLLRLLGLFLGHALEHRLRRRLDEVLGLLEPEAGQAAHLLDDADLLVAGVGEHDVVGALLLLGATRVAATATGGGGRGDRRDGSRRGHAEALLELLQELGELQDRHVGDRVEDLFLGRHVCHSSSVAASAAGSSAAPASAAASFPSSSAGADSSAPSAGASVLPAAPLAPPASISACSA